MKTLLLLFGTCISYISYSQKLLTIDAKQHTLSTDETEKLSEILKDFKAYDFSGKNLINKIDPKKQDFVFQLEGTSQLNNRAVSFIDSRIITEKTINRNKEKQATVYNYRGIELGPKEIFSLTVYGNSIFGGYQSSSGELLLMRPLSSLLGSKYSSNIIIVYDNKATKSKSPQLCGDLSIDNSIEKTIKNTKSARQITSTYNYCRIVRVAIEADNEWNTWHGANAYSDMVALFNACAGHYYTQANIQLEMVNSYVWTTTDPYSNATATGGTRIAEMQSYWSSNNSGISRDCAFMFSRRVSTDFVGVAYANSVCGSYAYGMILNPLSELTAVMHEFGHLLGHSGHDNASPFYTMYRNNDSSSTTLSAFSLDLLQETLQDYGDNSCVVHGGVNMYWDSAEIDAYETNNSCFYDYEYLSAPGNHTISWSLSNSGTNASISSSSATTASISSGNASGTYEIKASKSNDCGTIDRYYYFYVDNCFFMRVYPNATSDYLYVHFDKESKAIHYPDEISLLDDRSNVLIKKLPQEMLKNNEIDTSDPKITLDLSELTPGTYYLRLYFKNRGENQFETKRILKLPK